MQVIHEDLYSKSVENLLFNIADDPNEEKNLAAKKPKLVKALASSIAGWAASHPVAGRHVEIAPNPGWLPPKDWAEVVIPTDKVQASSYDGFEEGTAKRLNQAYEGRGAVIYE